MQTISRSRLDSKMLVKEETLRNIYRFFEKRGFIVCSVTRMANSTNWFAVLTNKKDFILSTVFINASKVERVESTIMG